MTTSGRRFLSKTLYRTFAWIILILGCLFVPYTHGYLQYFGLIFIALLLVFTLAHFLTRDKKTSTSSTKSAEP